MTKHYLSASILAADFAHLGQECRDVINAGVDYIHFDVMDHHFVPNLSFGAVVCESLRKAGITAPIDVHLMVDNPEAYIEPFAKAGANLMTFHREVIENVGALIQKIHGHGMQAGLAFNPENPIDLAPALIKKLAMILVMSVNPGFAGQSFMPESLDKLRRARALINQAQSNTRLGIDGGVKLSNIADVANAGADFFVLGSGLFAADDYSNQIKQLREKLA